MIARVSRMEKHRQMTSNSQKALKLRVSELDPHKPNGFEIIPAPKARKIIAGHLDLIELPKLRFSGEISAVGNADWALSGELGATVVQACVVSLKPVRTRIDTGIARQFLANCAPFSDSEEEIEIPDDVNSEPLGTFIDLDAVMLETLSLALPLYPKAQGAELGDTTFSKEGVKPMSDDDARPFAGLAALRDTLGKEE